MSIAEQIRQLARMGVPVAEIAKRLGIRYQHAYNVIKKGTLLNDAANIGRPTPLEIEVLEKQVKPPLLVKDLISCGFSLATKWTLSPEGVLVPGVALPKQVGVYAFGKGDTVIYVGVATMGISKRLYFYGRPGKTQRTSQRLNSMMKNELASIPSIEIYVAFPPDLEWNGLPVHGSAGLELGLIKKYHLPWNMRSAN